MAYVAQMLTQEPIYKSSLIFCFKSTLLSAHKLILLIYDDNRIFSHMKLKYARKIMSMASHSCLTWIYS